MRSSPFCRAITHRYHEIAFSIRDPAPRELAAVAGGSAHHDDTPELLAAERFECFGRPVSNPEL